MGSAEVHREGANAPLIVLGDMVPGTFADAEELSKDRVYCTVIDVRSLVPLVTSTPRHLDGPARELRRRDDCSRW
jgi:pyruvate dehydrogenase E1 component beta subunit